MSIDKNKNFFAVFGLFFGAMTWGVIWYPYRLLGQAGFSGIHSSFYTYGIAACLACFIFAKHWRGLFSQPKNVIWLILAAGWTNLSYVLAVIDGEVMRVMLLFYLSPVWTLLLAHFWLKERAGTKGVVVVAVSLLGASIMLYTPAQPSHFPLPHNLSEWLALSSGMGFALTNVITRKSTHLSLVTKSFAVWVGVIFMSLMSMLILGESVILPSTFLLKDWMLVVLIALMLFASTLFVQYGVTHIAAIRASIIFLFELLVAAVAAYYLANEVMTLNEWVGGLLIVLAAIYSATSYAD
ncbi:MAG: DMT family transporter [Methylophilaceae bacterium]